MFAFKPVWAQINRLSESERVSDDEVAAVQSADVPQCIARLEQRLAVLEQALGLMRASPDQKDLFPVYLVTQAPAKKTPRPGPSRRGVKWTIEEDELIRKQFENGASVAEIAGEQKRTSLAILARLAHLELLPPELRLTDNSALPQQVQV